MTRALALAALLAACGGGPVAGVDAPAAPPVRLTHSSSIAVSADGGAVYVVNADADSVSVLDPAARALTAEIPLGGGRPVADPASGAFTPAVMPRALALAPDGATLYVTGERAGALYAIDLATRAVRSVGVGSEPIGVAVAADGATVYVACSQDATVAVVDAAALTVTRRIAVPAEPWALGWAPDGQLLVTHFLGARVSAIALAGPGAAGDAVGGWVLPATAPRGDRRLAHGEVRGLYDVAARPGTRELWVAHVLLGTDTAQPALDFESTVFPALAIVDAQQGARATLSTDAQDVPGIDGAFGDVVSGPHALAFTRDGGLALVVDTNSEDLLAVDATTGIEAALLRPLPGHMPEGIALAPDESVAYIDERNSGDVAVVRLDRTGAVPALAVDGAVIPRFAAPGDPMPPAQRRGQHVFFSANSDELPVTQNHWAACASCHLEGRSDAVTWRFAQGPRDTPTNAGGVLGTGFLFRTADRTAVSDYWRTVNIEQGGHFDPVADASALADLTAFVNVGLPAPVPPTTDAALVAAGRAIFERADVGCATCHSGARFTDSGAGNPALDLGGPVVLHDVGTCVTAGPYDDVAHADIAGHARAACAFDTPSLTGLASTPPYLHDGRAATIRDVLELTRGTMGNIAGLSADEEAALVEYLRSL